MVTITLVLHTVWGAMGLGKHCGVLLVASVLDPAKNIQWWQSSTWQRYMATTNPWRTITNPPLLNVIRTIYLPRLYIATIKSPLSLTIHYLILQMYRS